MQKPKTPNTEELKIKVKDTCLGHLMKEVEKEKNIPLARAKKLLR